MTSFDETVDLGSKYWHYASIRLDQAALLLSGADPDGEHCGKSYIDLPKPIRDWVDILNNAIRGGALPANRIYVNRNGAVEMVRFDDLGVNEWVEWRTELYVAEVKKWHAAYQRASGRQSSFHVSEDQSQSASLGTRERETLLGLIAVLAELAGIDLRPDTKGHAEAASIMEELRARKMNIDKRTVAAKLAAARELIAPKGPGRITNGSK
jgi:hypothetical protein